MESELRKRILTSKESTEQNGIDETIACEYVSERVEIAGHSVSTSVEPFISTEEQVFDNSISDINFDNNTGETTELDRIEECGVTLLEPVQLFNADSLTELVKPSLVDPNANGLQDFQSANDPVDMPQVTDDGLRNTINGLAASDLSFREVPETALSRKKVKEIEAVLSKKPVSVNKLKKLALSEGGLINDTIRKKVWHRLVGIDRIPPLDPLTEKQLEHNEEYNQVVLDVNRSLKRFPPGIPYDQRVVLQDQLTRLIMRVIIKYPHLRYYQGYHDVAVTILLVVGEEAAFPIMEKLSTGHFSECMAETMEETSHLLNYIYPLLKRMHPGLYAYMERSSCGTLFCLPWYLTWFGHNLNHYTDVVRLYDFFLCSDKLLSLYLAAAIVVYRADEIFNVECDMPYIHSLLSNIPDDLPFERLLKDAADLYKRYPPRSIEKEVKERTKNAQRLAGAMVDRRLRRHDSLRNLLNLRPRLGKYTLVLATATIFGLYAYFHSAI